MKLISHLFIVALSSLIPTTGFAAAIFAENAGNPYYSGGWASGSSQINNFGWANFNNSTPPGFAGHFIGDSTNLSSPGNFPDINVAGKSFGLNGASGGGGFGQADSYGFLTDGAANNAPLLPGQTLAIDLAVDFRNGYKGFAARNFSDNSEIFTFVIGGDDYVVYNATTGNGSIGNTYSFGAVFHLAVTQTSAAGGVWEIIRTAGVNDYDTGTYSGAVSNFKLFCGQTDGGNRNDLMANNISVTNTVPEPSSVLLLSIGVSFCVTRRAIRSPRRSA